jgi:hypothetical protein
LQILGDFMKIIRFLPAFILVNLTASSLALAAQSDDSLVDKAPRSCLEEAASRYKAQLASIQITYLKSLESCDGPGPHGFADRCLLVASRRNELLTQKAHDSYLAEKEACGSVIP